MQLSDIKKYKWERGEQWQEKWYSTQLCFETFAKDANPLVKFFAPKGLTALALNSLWFYEKNTSKQWDEGKDKIALDDAKLALLLKESKKLLKRSESILSETVDSKKIDKLVLLKIKEGLLILWSIFLADLGRPLGVILEKRFKKAGLNPNEIQEVKNYCFSTRHKFGFQQEEESLKKISIFYKKKYPGGKFAFKDLPSDIKKMLIDHTNKFQYLTGGDLNSDAYRLEDFYKKLSAYYDKKNSSTDLSSSLKKRLNTSDMSFLNLVKRHIYVDNHAADINAKLDYFMNKLLSESFNISFKNLSWYSFNELEDIVLNRNIQNDISIKERKRYRVMTQINGEIATFYGKQNCQNTESFLNIKQTKISVKRFEGMVACRGIINGRVKIVKTIEDISKVKFGDILVSTNTHPDLIIAIKLSGGIITDYGGMTSHAAIVSREFNIPCIVGTSIATQVLKDGDYVSLDANKGVVKILNRANT